MSGSPTLKLHNLTSASNRMLDSLINMQSNPTIEKSKKTIQALRRRSYIMSLLYDKCIVAVAGLQGVGKSTLMSNLYDFKDDNSPFLGNQGQGETLPILITECENPGQLFLHKFVIIDGISTFVREEILDVKMFREKAHKYNDNEDLLLEVTVKFKIFNCSDRRFLLLPGFQKESGYLKELTYTALRTSMNCLILFYNNKYANRDNQELIETINSDFREASPIFTLTCSDNEDDNIELAEKVKRDLFISEEDRVIRSGSPGPQGWKDQLAEAVRKYSVPSTGVFEVQNRNMEKLIDDYYSVIAEIEVGLQHFDVIIENTEFRQVEKYIKIFHNRSEDIRKELKSTLDKVLNSYYGRIQKAVKDELVKQYGGWDGFLKSAGEFFKKGIVVRNEFEKLVEDCSKAANINSVQEELLIVHNGVATDFWGRYTAIISLPVDEKTKYDKKTLLTGNGDKRELLIPTEAFADIAAILNPDPTVQFSKDLDSSMRLLPILALESCNIVALGISEKDFPQNADSLIRHYMDNKKEVAVGVGVLFGLDILEGDGIDLFGLIQHNAANGGSAMAAASFHWALAALAVGAGLVYMLDQMSKSVDKKANELNYYVEKMKDHTIEKVLTNYDAAMQRFEDILRGCLERKHGIQEGFANGLNCELSRKHLEDTAREIEKIVKVGKWVN